MIIHDVLIYIQSSRWEADMLFHRVGLVFFSGRAKSEAFAREADSFLRARGCKTVFPVAETDSGKLDLIITFGGDGTLLAGAGLAVKNNAPLLGVNLGTVGFLTEAEPSALEDVLTGIIDGKYQTEQRSLLHIKNEKTGEEFTALNDAVITRGGYARIIQINSFVDGKPHDFYTADGIIAATPTGSTGYSLSAGGPVVEPGMSCMIITPVCAHSLNHCSTIVSDKSEVRFVLREGRQQTAVLQVDGRSMGTLEAGDSVIIRGSDLKLQLIRTQPYDFFDLMRRKLTEWGSSH